MVEEESSRGTQDTVEPMQAQATTSTLVDTTSRKLSSWPRPKQEHGIRGRRIGQHVVTIHDRDWWILCSAAHTMRLSANDLVSLIARNYVKSPYPLELIPEEDGKK